MLSTEFLSVLSRMIPDGQLRTLCEYHAPRPRSARKLSSEQLISGLVFHQLQAGGTLADHSAQLHGIRMSDSAYAQRRQHLPVELFEQIMDQALRPLADPMHQPECFFEGYRLVGIDGTQWSVSNTPAIVSALPKAASRRLQAAFAKLRLVSVVELGTHAPLAALAAAVSESEQALAGKLWEKIPEHSLLIADRLFGTGLTLWQALSAWQDRDITLLVRIRDNLKAEVKQRLPDGSALVEVLVRDEEGRVITHLQVREIRASGVALTGKRFNLRLWTTLLDPTRYPADTLARHYAERWEHELYYRELKLDVRSAPILASHTVETALQEIAALVLASAVLAHLRVRAAQELKVPPSRMSFFKLILATQQLWTTFALMGQILTAAQRQHAFEQYLDTVRHTAVLPERRDRSCPRVLRQPVSSWPRKTNQKSYTGSVKIKLERV
jgi:Transposase DDE domain